MATVAQSLITLRHDWGITQSELGDKHVISRIEHGHIEPGMSLRVMLTEKLNEALAAREAGMRFKIPEVVAMCRACKPAPKAKAKTKGRGSK